MSAADARTTFLRWLVARNTERGGLTELRDAHGRWATLLASDAHDLQHASRVPGLRVRLHAVGGRARHEPTLHFRTRRPRSLDVLVPDLMLAEQGRGPTLWTTRRRARLVRVPPRLTLDPGAWIELDAVRAFELRLPGTAVRPTTALRAA